MPRLSRSTLTLFFGLTLVQALYGWIRLAEVAGVSTSPVVSRLLLSGPLRRQEAVRAEVDATLERRRRARALASSVAQGDLTLREGAARLRELYRATPSFPWHVVERKFPGASQEECCCRLLLGELRSLEGPDGEQARGVALRLEAELEMQLRCAGSAGSSEAAPSA